MRKSFCLLFFVFGSLIVSAQEQTDTVAADTIPAMLIDSTTVTVSHQKVKMKDCYYNFHRDFSYDWAPFAVGALAMSSSKTDIRAARNKLTPDFKTGVDDYLQYSPLLLTCILKASGVESRSDWWRFLASGAMAYAVEAALVNAVKYTAQEPRPDGTSNNSFPSGHTATAFVAATILHKEYGLTRSPWYSVAGYSLATATGALRVMNNRHWISDVLCGAGIGIISTDLGYFFADLIFRDKHLKRQELLDLDSYKKYPSFISLETGAAFLPDVDVVHVNTATAVATEFAYFFHPNFGVGLQAKVTSAEARYATGVGVLSDQFVQFHADLGAYAQYPFADHFCVGGKITYGRLTSCNMDFKSESDPNVWLYSPTQHTNKLGLGLSIAYSHKNNTTWKLHCDYDYSQIPFELRTPVANYSRNKAFHMLSVMASANIRF